MSIRSRNGVALTSCDPSSISYRNPARSRANSCFTPDGHVILTAASAGIPQSEVQLLRVLRQVSASRVQILDSPVDFDARADPVAIGFRPAQPQRDRALAHAAVVAQHADLRPQAALQHDIQVAVAIDIGCGERAGVVGEVQPADAREVIEFRCAAVRGRHSLVENVGLMAAPAVLLADELIDRVPAVFILRSRGLGHGRLSHHLPPEETVDVLLRGSSSASR